MKTFFGLSFLTSAEVSKAFRELIERSPSEDALEFSDYILENYIKENSLFTPEIWSEVPSRILKTKNGPESFHKRYNKQFYSAYPSVWKVTSNYKY